MSSESIADLVSLRSTGTMPSPSNQAFDSRPLTPVPVKYSAFARNTTFLGATTGMTTLSTNDRWLLASRTPPVRGTFSVPSTTGRHTALRTGGTTECRTV
jgi:hypothetical protein